MGILKYFQHNKPSKEERIQSILPKPDGPLERLMPSSAIEASAVYETKPGNVKSWKIKFGGLSLGVESLYTYVPIYIKESVFTFIDLKLYDKAVFVW